MRITNTEYTPIELIAELLVIRGIKNNDTHEFFSGDGANHDWLTQTLAQKIDVVLESFRRYGTQVAETQCIRDNGIDVRLTTMNEGTGNETRIGFQIKSNNEAERESKRPPEKETMIATLKRQAFEAEQHGHVNEWWILSCFDLTKRQHQRLVSFINTEIGTGKKGGLRIRHVTPKEAMAFLSMPDDQIDAICTLLLCEDDEVLKKAQHEVFGMSPITRIIVLGTLGAALEGKRNFTLDELERLARNNEFEGLSEIADDINALESSGYLATTDGINFHVESALYVGLCALYFEARARHEHTPNRATQFIEFMTDKD